MPTPFRTTPHPTPAKALVPLALALALAACSDMATNAATTAAPTAAGANGAAAPLFASDAQRDQFDEQVHDYLNRHPEVLMEMSQALRQKQQASAMEQTRHAIAVNHAALYDNAADPVVGNPSGAITVVEFFDAQCPFCKRTAPELERLIAENKDVRLIYKEFPILGPGSVTAAKAALASMKQGKYEPFHNALMADTTPEHQLDEPRVLQIAKSVGIDVERLKRDMAAPEIQSDIDANIALAKSLGVNGTPGLIIGDQLTPGAMPYEAMMQELAAARTAKATHG